MRAKGICKCGCGGTTRIAPRTSTEKGWKKGEPLDYVNGHNGRKHTLAYEVDPATGCWNWLGSKTWNGYGQGSVNNQKFLAHRLYWERANGPVPDGLHLDHLCRNRGCVNPSHLELVTNRENARRGAATKLTEVQAREIKYGTERCAVLMERFGIAQCTVSAIRRGRLWPDI